MPPELCSPTVILALTNEIARLADVIHRPLPGIAARLDPGEPRPILQLDPASAPQARVAALVGALRVLSGVDLGGVFGPPDVILDDRRLHLVVS